MEWNTNYFIFHFIKKSREFSAVIVLLSLIIPCFTFSQVNYSPNQKWKWLHPTPQANALRWCKMWDKNTWYMAGDFGTFMKTSDGGTSWVITYNASRLQNTNFCPFKGQVIDAHFFNQNTGIAVGQFSSAYKTTNGGSTFDSIPELLRVDFANWNAVFFVNENTGYVAGHNSGFAKTTDAGNSWTYISSVPPGNHYGIWTPNDTLIIISSNSGNIQRSTDGGLSWATVSTGSSAALYNLCFINRDTGFVCGSSGSARLTTNGGINWTNINSGLPNTTIEDIDYKISGQNSEVYLTGNQYFIYKTTDLGTTWSTVSFWGSNQSYMGQYMYYCSTELGGGDTLLTVGNMGLVNKRNSSIDRTLYTNFLRMGGTGVMSDVWIDGNKIWGVGNPTGNGGPMDDQVIFSSDGGISWIKQNTGGSSEFFASIFMLNSSTGFIAGSSGEIRKTVNGGSTWELIANVSSANLQKIEFVNDNTGWVFGTGSVIFKTTNAGNTWVQQTAPVPSGSDIFDADMVDQNTGWFCGSYRATPPAPNQTILCKTTNGGLSWVAENHNVNGPGRGIIGIKMLNNNLGYFGGYRIFYKTNNGGTNWDSLAIPYPEYQITGIDFINEQTGMLLDGFQTLKTTNGGESWIIDGIGTSAFFSEYAPQRLKMISEDVSYLAGTYASILRYSSFPIGIIEWETGVPEKYELYQNYPNPFNPATTIKFTLPKVSKILLRVYDIAGREIKTIIDQTLNPGTVKYIFDGNEYASGIYFYTLYAEGNLVSTKKMVLLK